MERFFRTSPPTLHTMIKTLEREGFIRRQSGVARSLHLIVDADTLPLLVRPA
jgi:repressor LexA